MLAGHFYNILKTTEEEGIYRFLVSFEKDHPIFRGHFPGNPVVPGVTLNQMTKELAELVRNEKFLFSALDSVKFLQVINPDDGQQLQVSITLLDKEDGIAIQAEITDTAVIYYKLKGSLGRV
jgi:3-hydroxyacyl-[acyl-carrier-protein] dehydratase